MNTQNGLSFPTAFFLVLLVMKLTHTIEYSWWLITAPLWVPIATALIIILVIGLILGICNIIEGE